MSGKKREEIPIHTSPRARRFSPEEKRKALELIASGMTYREVAKTAGASMESLRLWKRKAGQDGVQAVEKPGAEVQDGPPVLSPGGLAVVEVEAVMELKKKHPSMGPAQVQAQLRRFKGWQLSRKAIARVFRDNGYELVHIASRPKGDEVPHRWEAPRRNAVWQLDFADLRIGPEKRALLLVLDDFSRFVVGWDVFEAPTGESVVEVLEAAIRKHGKPEATYTDRGGVFLDWNRETSFQRFLDEQLIDHIVGHAYHPQGRGKVEALIKSIRRELWDVRHFESWDEGLVALGEWVRGYNHQRAHMGIDGLTPADRFFGRWDEVRARMEASSRGRASSGDLGSVFEEQGAPVEVVRILAVDGKVELRLLGHRIALGQLDL